MSETPIQVLLDSATQRIKAVGFVLVIEDPTTEEIHRVDQAPPENWWDPALGYDPVQKAYFTVPVTP